MSTIRLAFITFPVVLGFAVLTSACGVPLAVSGAGYAADGGLLVETHKTSTDHLISMVSKQDCALWRVIKGRKVCQERVGEDPYKVDYNDPQRSVSEDGVQYGPPLRPSADAPAASWDAAAYRQEPAPVHPAAEPTTAIAETSPAAAAPVAAPASAAPAKPAAAAPAKAAKPKARSVRKTSPRPAASGS